MPDPMRISDVNAEFIAGKDTFLFQEVLDDIPNAKMVRLLTFNAETHMFSKLYDSLHKMKCDTDFKWVFNFVSRKSDNPKYVRYFNKEKFERHLTFYGKIIESPGFESRVDVVINCTNHAKLFGTENVLYVGSQNFSEASVDNHELGFIVRDKRQIQKIYQFFDVVYNADESIHYYCNTEKAKRLTIVLIVLSTVISVLDNMYAQNDAEVYDNSYACQFVDDEKKELDYVLSELKSIAKGIQKESYYPMFKKAVGLLKELYKEINNDQIIEDLMNYNFSDRQDEETENYENKYEDWAVVRDEDIIKEFDSMYNVFVAKGYLEKLQDAYKGLKIVHKEIGKDQQFMTKLNNANFALAEEPFRMSGAAIPL